MRRNACATQVPEGEFGLLFTDGSKFGRGEQLHIGLLALWAFQKKEKRLPTAGNLEEADAVAALAHEVRIPIISGFAVLFDSNIQLKSWRIYHS